MRSLTTHLRQPDGHGPLPFHPECPICTARLFGAFSAPGLVSPRTQAVLAAGVLVCSTTVPATAALAAERDQDNEGKATVVQGGAADAAVNPDFDPGGGSTDLGDSAPAVPQTPAPPDTGDDDIAPVDQDPATDPSDLVADTGDGSGASANPDPPDGPSQPASPTTSSSSEGADTMSESPAPATSPPASTVASAPVAQDDPPGGADRSSEQAGKRVHTEPTGHRAMFPRPPGFSAATMSAAVIPARATQTPLIGAGGRPAKPGDRTHTVLPGESLWSIATDLLGGDATTARVAREVHRLWQLNRDRIGTGDPDLLMIGTRLALQ